MGRFLLAVDQQEEEQKRACQQKRKAESLRKPTIAESKIARKELDLIFSGPNKTEAEKLYWRGLNAVASGRKPPIDAAEKFMELRWFTDSLGVEIFGAVSVCDPGGHTPEALFYIHVERLTEVANLAYDTPRE